MSKSAEKQHHSTWPESGLGFGGAKSSAEGARIETPQAPRVYGDGAWGGDTLSPLGLRCPIPRKKSIFGSRNAYFGAFSRVFSSALFLYCTSLKFIQLFDYPAASV